MTPESPSSLPRVAYVLLWFPLSSETFIFREVCELRNLGLNVRVYTTYGKRLRGCSREMRDYSGSVVRMGAKAAPAIMGAFFRSLRARPALTRSLLKEALFRRTRNFESALENTWCFFAGFLLAEYCQKDKIDLIHSAWANGPATAAWIASRLSGIPFAFTGRAGDIYPQDGLLKEKAAAALFIRANNAANVKWLSGFLPPNQGDKTRLVYNGLTFQNRPLAPRPDAAPPYRLLAVGRFARTKGFPELLTAIARLKRERFPVELTLVGDGAWKSKLLKLRSRLGLENVVKMPGFIPNDKLAAQMLSHHLLVVPSVVHKNGDRDGIPNVIMEALSLETPVVATDVCGVSEVVRDGQTGFLAPQRDPATLARAIRAALENYPRAKAMAGEGRKLVLEMFDSQKNAQSLKNLYLESARQT